MVSNLSPGNTYPSTTDDSHAFLSRPQLCGHSHPVTGKHTQLFHLHHFPQSTPTQSRNSFVIPQKHSPALYIINLIPVILLLSRQPVPPTQCSKSPLCWWFQLYHEQISLPRSHLGINTTEEDICVIPSPLFEEFCDYSPFIQRVLPGLRSQLSPYQFTISEFVSLNNIFPQCISNQLLKHKQTRSVHLESCYLIWEIRAI